MVIPEFYEDCEIFVTGGSGVVGKALIDKLLRSCNVRRIYLLLRTRKDKDVEQRLDKIRNAKVFRILRSTKPEQLQKLVAIPGDATQPNLGITPESAKLMENVSLVFHCAATIRFDEPLKYAMMLNVAGTHEALKFAETLKQLKMFMHVSTFYSNTYLKYVEPKVYESPMDWRMCLNLIANDSNPDILDFLTKKLITGFPNTYTFTKNLAESVVNDFRHRLPVAIYRPSIVLFALSDPEPGYPPTLMGAMGLFAMVGAGILKTVYLGQSTRLDLTPQDFCIKTMIYYTWRADQEYRNGIPESAPVYQSSSCKHSPHSFKTMAECVEDNNIWEQAAYETSLLIPGCVYTSCRFYYQILVFTHEVFPALIVDLLLRISGRKPAILGIVRKVYSTLEVMKPFMFNDYDSSGITHYDDMCEVTKGTEFCLKADVLSAGNDEGLRMNVLKMVYKIREVLFNEDPATLPRARKILKIKKMVWNVIRGVIAYFILRWLYRVVFVEWLQIVRIGMASMLLLAFHRLARNYIETNCNCVWKDQLKELEELRIRMPTTMKG